MATNQIDMKAEYEYRANHLIRVGSIVRPKKFIAFCNGKIHNPVLTYTVSAETLSYFVVNFQSYQVVQY